MRPPSSAASPQARRPTRRRSARSWGRSRRSSQAAERSVTQLVQPGKRRRSPQTPTKLATPTSYPALPKWRLLLVWGVLIGGTLGLGWQAYQLQHVQREELAQKALEQQEKAISPYVPRRTVSDRQGQFLATDRLTYTLYAHPKLFKPLSLEETAAQLAPILSQAETPTPLTKEVLLEKFQQRETGIKIAARLTESVAREIQALRSNGLDLEQHYARFYPQDEMAAGVMGFVNVDREGQAGIEQSQTELLHQETPEYVVRQTGRGDLVPNSVPPELLTSDHLQMQLTLDIRLQQASREALRQHMRKYNAKRGTVIIMDARDGAILSLVCEPTYNPNQYWRYDFERFKNWAVSDLYEPGSTFKPINVAIALEAGVIEPHAYVYDAGKVPIDGWDIFNHDYHSRGGRGSLSLAQVLQYSSNVGMIRIMQRLKREDYYAALRNLGLGETVGSDLPGDAKSHLKSKEDFTIRWIEAATAAFGQGLSLTPLKLVQLHGAITNGGELVTPHVIQGLVDTDGNYHWQPEITRKRVFSPATSQHVLRMMESVVEVGSGKPAQIEGYRIGGKTGTAQKAAGRGYSSHAKITSFVAMLPIESPRYVVAAVIDEPQGSNTFGSTVAAPIVKQVMEALISVEGLPPANRNPSQ